MTVRKSFSIVLSKFLLCASVAGGITLLGCTSETMESSPTKRAEQSEIASKEVNQAAKSKTGRSTGPPIVGKSIKSKVLSAPKE